MTDKCQLLTPLVGGLWRETQINSGSLFTIYFALAFCIFVYGSCQPISYFMLANFTDKENDVIMDFINELFSMVNKYTIFTQLVNSFTKWTISILDVRK